MYNKQQINAHINQHQSSNLYVTILKITKTSRCCIAYADNKNMVAQITDSKISNSNINYLSESKDNDSGESWIRKDNKIHSAKSNEPKNQLITNYVDQSKTLSRTSHKSRKVMSIQKISESIRADPPQRVNKPRRRIVYFIFQSNWNT